MAYVTDMPEGWYAVRDTKRGVGFGVSYPKDLFEFLWFWQSYGGGFGYPGTAGPTTSAWSPSRATQHGAGPGHRQRHRLVLEAGARVEASYAAVAYTGDGPVSRIAPDGSVEMA